MNSRVKVRNSRVKLLNSRVKPLNSRVIEMLASKKRLEVIESLIFIVSPSVLP
jgi:hypothetical protein